VAHPKGQG
jgi:hypothetical protein